MNAKDLTKTQSGERALLSFPVVCSMCESTTQDIVMCEIRFTQIATNSFDTGRSVSVQENEQRRGAVGTTLLYNEAAMCSLLLLTVHYGAGKRTRVCVWN